MAGKVYLLGAGPGAADLLTVRALRVLSQADTVIFDPGVDPDVLALIHRAAEVYPSDRFGEPPDRQERIFSLIVDRTLAGKQVIRLKDGDPLVFSDGAEEWAFLAERGILVEFVPGVSSALGMPALAGVPLTCRGFSGSFAVLNGHLEAKDSDHPPDWSCCAGIDTLVILRGNERCVEIAEELIQAGRDPGEPVMFVEESPAARSPGALESTLGSVARGEAQISRPALLVVGEVVKMRSILTLAALFSGMPMLGQ